MRDLKYIKCLGIILTLLFLLGPGMSSFGQKTYSIKDGRMIIQLPKKISEAELDSFIIQFDLADLDLKTFVKTGIADSLKKLGWDINLNNEKSILISKQLFAIDDITNPAHKIIFSNEHPDFSQVFPAVSNAVHFGYNRFQNKYPFATADSITVFFLRGFKEARGVMLAGSFNNWSPDSLAMTRSDSGWTAHVKLGPGKYWYKFIADGHWMTDPDNLNVENDGKANHNSVYFKTNTVFTLDGFTQARKVFLSGSFNNWKPKDLVMVRTATGWALPLYLADGTHSYKFVVDGKWYADDKNQNRIPDGTGGFNSVTSLGEPHLFTLKGFENARQVMLVGSFNNWRDFEWPMKKTPQGWELPLVIGDGNHEYKFKVDDKWISDPGNPLTVRDGNSFLVVKPNYTFRLKGYGVAGKVLLAGDFNDWRPEGLPMKKDGDDWILSLHLDPGKVRYKFIVDGKWIIDPSNKEWEQNEYGTGNSVIWVEGQ